MRNRLERPTLKVVTSQELTPQMREAFEIAGSLAEQGFSYIQGESEYRKFYKEVQENIGLLALIGVSADLRHVIDVKRAFLNVIDLTDTSEAHITISRDSATVTEISVFEEYVLERFREVA